MSKNMLICNQNQVYSVLWRCGRLCSSTKPLVGRGRIFSTSAVYSKTDIDKRWNRKTERYMERAALKVGTGGESVKSRKKRPWFDAPVGSSIFPGLDRPGGQSRRPSAGSQRRARQLSVVLFEYISSLINSGEICPELQDLGFQIERVRMAANFGMVTVYWLASGTKQDEEIQRLTESCAGELRSALINLRIMGNMPPIHFAKDLTQAKLGEVQHLLDTADMGDDHEPLELGEEFKSDADPLLHFQQQSEGIKQGIRDLTEKFAAMDRLTQYGSGYKVTEITGNRTANANDFSQASHEFHEKFPDGESSEDNCADSPPLPGLDLRSDMYHVNHSALLQQVLRTKRRARDRTYEAAVEAAPARHKHIVGNWDKQSLTSDDITQVLANHRRKQKVGPNVNRLLRSAVKNFHRDRVDLESTVDQDLEEDENLGDYLDDSDVE